MNKPVRIDSSNKIDYNIEMYIKPEFVYVPLENKNGTTYKYLVKEGDYVYKGMIVAINKDNNFPVHSSVSGYAVCGTNNGSSTTVSPRSNTAATTSLTRCVGSGRLLV